MDIQKLVNESVEANKQTEEQVTVASLFESMDSFCISSAISAGLGSKAIIERMRDL